MAPRLLCSQGREARRSSAPWFTSSRTRCCIRSAPDGHDQNRALDRGRSVAFVVGTTIGLNNGRASADYIHLYHGNAALLAESLEVIQRTAAVILAALENDTRVTAEEQEIEPGPALAKAS